MFLQCRFSRALRTGFRAFEAILWQNINLLHFILAMPTNSLAVPSPSLGVYHCNKCDMRNLREQYFTIVLHHYVLFHLAKLFIRGNSRYLFPKCWNRQICHTHWEFKLSLRILSSKLQTMSTPNMSTPKMSTF